MIVALAIHDRAGRTRQPSPYPPENVAAFRALTDAIHEAGGKIFGEPFYWWGGFGQWQPLSPPGPSLGASVRQLATRDQPVSTRSMNKEEIATMLGVFRQTAANMRAAGFDGVFSPPIPAIAERGTLRYFAVPELGNAAPAYGLSCFGDTWRDACAVARDLRQQWRSAGRAIAS